METNLAQIKVVQRHLGFWINVFQVPSKGVAFEIFP